MADEKWSEKIVENYRERSKLFWKEMKKSRSKRGALTSTIKTVDGNVVQDDTKIEERWREHFKELLNVGKVDERKGRVVENIREEENRSENLGQISKNEIGYALKKTKGGKSPGLDSIQVEMLKKGGNCVVEWLRRLFNVCWQRCEVPQDWQDSCLVPIYKGKGDKMGCSIKEE